MKALSVKQPWLDAILYGGKTTENRRWPVPDVQLGTPVLLHASASPDRRAVLPQGIDSTKWPRRRGAILAVATLASFHRDTGCCRPWGEAGTYHWQLADIQLLHEPIPCRGALKFWTPPTSALDAVTAQLTTTNGR
ncbi:hypothetical protein ACIHCQ_42205 [Streptomyces sp. NPDC052236]|uniref:hypothetical protein n=1 Tax=Streptomyces sp. NPDC052236 TaxID=3365686 RepID=UPI0037D7DCDE